MTAVPVDTLQLAESHFSRKTAVIALPALCMLLPMNSARQIKYNIQQLNKEDIDAVIFVLWNLRTVVGHILHETT
jgi:cytochrome bd-type quinol oxidase subunit 1